ncbi:MAG: tRNA threonylcarbamoyladenosine biosynthesis protein TsaB [Acidobacteriota bacterium]|nr:tRNA threonylcarbamoyladenosine biosynthesis protein TsaB [Acidobacteriota bacterium]
MKEESLTLSVDTSTEQRSVVVLRGPRLLSQCVSGLREGGSASLLTDIERALASASVTLKDVELFAAAVGPGSFTGLRSGLATLKGLAVVLAKPVVGVPTLHAIAYGARPGKRILALIPAGRGEVFAQLLGVDEAGNVVEHEAPAHLQPARLIEKMAGLGGGVKWIGSGAFKFSELIRQGAEDAGIEFVEAADGSADAAEGVWLLTHAEEALARSVAMLALSEEGVAAESSAENLSAIYVRPSDAELKGQWHAQS